MVRNICMPLSVTHSSTCDWLLPWFALFGMYDVFNPHNCLLYETGPVISVHQYNSVTVAFSVFHYLSEYAVGQHLFVDYLFIIISYYDFQFFILRV